MTKSSRAWRSPPQPALLAKRFDSAKGRHIDSANHNNNRQGATAYADNVASYAGGLPKALRGSVGDTMTANQKIEAMMNEINNLKAQIKAAAAKGKASTKGKASVKAKAGVIPEGYASPVGSFRMKPANEALLASTKGKYGNPVKQVMTKDGWVNVTKCEKCSKPTDGYSKYCKEHKAEARQARGAFIAAKMAEKASGVTAKASVKGKASGKAKATGSGIDYEALAAAILKAQRNAAR